METRRGGSASAGRAVGRETRARIMDVAEARLAESGYLGVPLEEVVDGQRQLDPDLYRLAGVLAALPE